MRTKSETRTTTATTESTSTYAERDLRAHRLLRQASRSSGRTADELHATVVTENLALARSLAHRYDRRGFEREDLEQVAMLGLVQAVRRYKPGDRPCFLAFAVPTILGELRRYFRDKGWSVRPPRAMQEAAQQVRSVHEGLIQDLGREPDRDEVAEATGMSAEQVDRARYVDGQYCARSLDAPVGTDQDMRLADTLGVCDVLAQRVETFAVLRSAIARLEPREQEVLRLRFIEDLTQRQIGDQIGVSQMQVSRLLTEILRQLRELIGEDGRAA